MLDMICESNNEEKYTVCFTSIYDFTITEQISLISFYQYTNGYCSYKKLTNKLISSEKGSNSVQFDEKQIYSLMRRKWLKYFFDP